MKQFFLPVLAIVFAGNFTDIDNAFNAFMPGSGESKQLKEEITEAGSVAQFEDTNGEIVTLNEGDAAVGVKDADGAPVGFRRADKSEVSQWVFSVPTSEPAEPAAEAVASNDNASNGSEDETQG